MRALIALLLGCTPATATPPAPVPTPAESVAPSPVAPAPVASPAAASASAPATPASVAALAKQLDAMKMGTLAVIDGQLVSLDEHGNIIPPKSSASASSSTSPPPPPTDPTKVIVATSSVGQSPSGDSGADKVIAQGRWRFTACHNKALASNPLAEGIAEVTLTLSDQGKATNSEVKSTTPEGLTECVRGAVNSLKFEPGTKKTLKFKVVFTRK